MTAFTSTAPPDEPDYTSPNGVPDYALREKEARLWLLSQADRAAGGGVEFDTASQRWVVAGVTRLDEVRCVMCPKIFRPSRNGQIYCSAACKQKALRSRGVTRIGRLIPT